MRLLALAGTVFLFVLGMVAPLQAQPVSSSSGDKQAQPPGAFSDLMDAIDSGSRLLIKQIQPDQERDLVENPRYNSQESPRHALMTFIEAMDLVQRGYEEVGYARAMASMPPDATREDARRLHAILLRLSPVSPAELPGPQQVERSGDTRYEFFPRGMDHQWIWDAVEVPPDAAISLVSAREGWIFSEATVDGAPDFLDAIASLPPRFEAAEEGQYFIMAFSPLLDRNGLLPWALFIGVGLIGLAAGFGFSRLLCWVAKKAQERDRPFLGTTLTGLGHSGGLVIFTFFFTVAIGFLELGPVLGGLRYAIPRFLMVVAVALLLISLIDVVAAFVKGRVSRHGGHYDKMVVTMVRRILRVFVITLIVIFVLQNLLGLNVGALLVGFGFLALALSLAAQDSVKNLFGAVSIFINRPFVIGDWIKFRGEMDTHIGVIEDIELQATKLKDLEGNLVTLPNMLFIDREVENLSARGYIRREVNIAIPYRAHADEVERALEALEEVFKDEEVLDDANAEGHDDEPHVSFFGFADSWLTIRGYHYYYMNTDDGEIQRDTERGWFSYLSHCSLVNRKIVKLFGERDIEFAFPTQTVALVPQEGEPIEWRRAADDGSGDGTDGNQPGDDGPSDDTRANSKAGRGRHEQDAPESEDAPEGEDA